MEQKRNSVDWNMKAFLGSPRVAMMTLEEEGAYRRALDYFYLQGWLPNDSKALAMLIGKNCSLQTAEKVKKMFKTHPKFPNQLTHDYLEKLGDQAKPENEPVSGLKMIPYELDRQQKENFKELIQQIFDDNQWKENACIHFKMTLNEVEHGINSFMLTKSNTEEFRELQTREKLSKNLFFFLPYSKNNFKNDQNELKSGEKGSRSEERHRRFSGW